MASYLPVIRVSPGQVRLEEDKPILGYSNQVEVLLQNIGSKNSKFNY
jgi:hypothetical protein